MIPQARGSERLIDSRPPVNQTAPPITAGRSDVAPYVTETASACACVSPACPSKITAAPSRMPHPPIEIGNADARRIGGTKMIAAATEKLAPRPLANRYMIEIEQPWERKLS